jgi:membrane protein YqaA with SNARE-associated domain
MADATGLWTLFASSFLASTLLPGGSEALLAYAFQQEFAPPMELWFIATLGNTLGGISNWIIGWGIRRFLPGGSLTKPAHQKALERIERYGSPLLLLSWLPVIGDPLCLAAGWMRIGIYRALLFIALGKGLRYAVLLFALDGHI